jgi:hypothetical protein
MKPVRVVTPLLITLVVSGCATAPGSATMPQASGPSVAPHLLIRLDLGTGGYPGFPSGHLADYLTDGTVVREHGGILERNRLTEAGLATVKATVNEAADLLNQPLRIEPLSTIIPMSNTNPMPGQVSEPLNTFVLERPDGTRYTVSAPSRPHAGDATVEGLTSLGDALRDPEALVGAGGLAGPWKPYQPAKTGIFLILEALNEPQIFTDGVMPHLSQADWPFAGSPLTFGDVFKGPGDHVTRRCALLPSGDVLTAFASLSKFGGRFGDGQAEKQLAAGRIWWSDGLLWGNVNQFSAVTMQAWTLMPEDGAVSCLDAMSL